MHTCDLIARHIDPIDLPQEPVEGVCCLTGENASCINRKHLLGKSFTNGDLLRRPESDLVSVAAYQALKHKWERMGSWYVDESGFNKLTRKGVRDMVFSESLGTTWAGYATTSYKKHGSLIAPVNTGKSRTWLFEMVLVDCADPRMPGIWQRLNHDLRHGIGRQSMETLEPNSYTLKEIGYHQWHDFERWARPYYQGSLYQFMCYLLPSQDELKHEKI